MCAYERIYILCTVRSYIFPQPLSLCETGQGSAAAVDPDGIHFPSLEVCPTYKQKTRPLRPSQRTPYPPLTFVRNTTTHTNNADAGVLLNQAGREGSITQILVDRSVRRSEGEPEERSAFSGRTVSHEIVFSILVLLATLAGSAYSPTRHPAQRQGLRVRAYPRRAVLHWS